MVVHYRVLGICVECEAEGLVSTTPAYEGMCAVCRNREYLKDYKERQDWGRRPNINRFDQHPEDKGCVLHPSCLTCPYPSCQQGEKTIVIPVETEEVPTKTAPIWRTSKEWVELNHIPSVCPHCGGKASQDGYPDEVWCWSSCCSSSILPHVRLPEGWVEPRPARNTIQSLT